MILVLTLLLSATAICESFTPKDHYLLFCGPPSNSASGESTFDGRLWSHDGNSTFASPSSFSSTVATLANHGLGVGSPFMAARIFNSNFTYSFPVSPGPKFLRLFFYPTLYDSQYDASQFFISVEANNHVLLRNFSAQLAVDYAPFTVSRNITTADPYVFKEYYITVSNSESSLKLTFSPTLPTSYAFINGIEVVSVPEKLSVSNKADENVYYQQIPFQISNSAALETAYRLNVGGRRIDVISDGKMCGMYRSWEEDTLYTFGIYGTPGLTRHEIVYTEQVPNYTAPELVYQSYRYFGDKYANHQQLNLTWRFKVDPGFYYMVRLHWCEVDSHINSTADRIFEVYINNITAETDANVMIWTNNQKYVPYYKDYVVFVSGGDSVGSSSVDIWIALHPNAAMSTVYVLSPMHSIFYHALVRFI